jgi:predicted phage terminase large subunit-like protein
MSKPSKNRGSAPLGVDELIRLARVDVGVFIVLMFPELHDGKQMVPAPYVNLMAEALMAVRDGGEKRLIFNLPPGHMKSLIISVLFSAWLLGVEPSKRILCVSYGDDLTRQLSRLTRRVMTSRRYRRIFPETVLTKLAEDLLTTTKGGQRLATAVGGTIAGFRSELTIIDDPMQPDEVASELKKQGLRDWYSGVVEQRLVPGGVMIVVMHRLAPDDFTATLLEKGGWLHISLPLIAVEALTYTDGSDRDFWTRRPGDLLSPDWTTQETVDAIRRSLPKEIFEGQYQQNPQFGGSGICSIDRLARFQERSHYELIVHCWDLAGTKSAGDWTVCAKFGLTQDQERREVFDLLEIIRVRIELPDVRELIRNQDRLEMPALVIVDGVGIGRAIVQELCREMQHLLPGGSFDDQNISGLKVRRFHNAMPAMYDGLVRLPTTMPGLETLFNEFAAFPDGRNDDQVDAVCNVAANRELIIRRARLFGERLGRIRPIPRVVASPTPPRSRDQELYDRRRQFRD